MVLGPAYTERHWPVAGGWPCPNQPCPQQARAWSVRSAHVCVEPTATAAYAPFGLLASPSSSSPQQVTESSSAIAQAWPSAVVAGASTATEAKSPSGGSGT